MYMYVCNSVLTWGHKNEHLTTPFLFHKCWLHTYIHTYLALLQAPSQCRMLLEKIREAEDEATYVRMYIHNTPMPFYNEQTYIHCTP